MNPDMNRPQNGDVVEHVAVPGLTGIVHATLYERSGGLLVIWTDKEAPRCIWVPCAHVRRLQREPSEEERAAEAVWRLSGSDRQGTR